MAVANSKELAKKLYRFKKPTRWDNGIGAELHPGFGKFWREWKCTQPSPVHYIHRPEKYEISPADGVTVLPVQNVPLPLRYPKEVDDGIWGGEAVVMGFYKKHLRTRRTRRYWVPQLIKSVVHSEILDKYMKTIVTKRTLTLIHENYGFDHYILKTPAYDLRSLLALKLKKEMLISLMDKTLYPNDPIRREEIYDKYINYANDCGYTREELDWYGMSWQEACSKHLRIKHESIKFTPLKEVYRRELLDKLQKEKEEEGGSESTWMSKINPFGKSTSNETNA